MNKVKVRIAVAVDAKGEWNSSGWGGKNEPDTQLMRACALEGTGADPVKVYWLEAELDVPSDEENVVRAVVKAE